MTVAAFDSREQAEVDCAARERKARKSVNPFQLRQGCLALLTSLEPGVFCDWVLDQGINPPPAGKGGSRDWAAPGAGTKKWPVIVGPEDVWTW